MAQQFALTAQLNLNPANLTQTVNRIQAAFNQLRIPAIGNRQAAALNAIAAVANRTQASLAKTTAAIQQLTAAQIQLRNVGSATIRVNQGVANSINNMGRASVWNSRQISLLTTRTLGFLAILNEARGVLEFDRSLTKLQQTSQLSGNTVQQLGSEIGRLAANTGASATNLLDAATVLSQAGKSFAEIRAILPTLAKVELGASFEGGAKSAAEAILALSGAFKGIDSAKRYEEVLSSISLISAKYAVESGDLITAIRKSGSAFSATGSELNELLALFTAIRQSTRLNAAEIANSLKSVSVRLLRKDTQDFLKNMGVDLAPNNQFVGQLKAFQEVAKLINSLPENDTRRSAIIEKVSGSFQFAKVAAGLQNVNVANEIFATLQAKSNQLTAEAAVRMDSLGGQIDIVKQSISQLFREMANDNGLKSLTMDAVSLAKALVQLVDGLRPALPLLAGLGAAAGLRFGLGKLGGVSNRALALGAVGVGGSLLANQGGAVGIAGNTAIGATAGGIAGSAFGPIGTGVGAVVGALASFRSALDASRQAIENEKISRLQSEFRLAETQGGRIAARANLATELTRQANALNNAGADSVGSVLNRFIPGNNEADELLGRRRAGFISSNEDNVLALREVRKQIIAQADSLADFNRLYDGAGTKINEALDLLDDGIRNFSTATINATRAEIEANKKKAAAQAAAVKAIEDQAAQAKKVKETEQQLASAIRTYVEATTRATNERLNAVKLTGSIATTNANIAGLPESQLSARLAGISQKQFEDEQFQLGGGLNAQGLGNRAGTLQRRIFEGEQQLRALPEDDKRRSLIQGSLDILRQQLDQTTQALRHMADATNSYSSALAKLNQLQQSQDSRLGLAEQFLSADASGRRKILIENQIAQQAVQANNLDFATDNPFVRIQKQQAAISGLKSLGKTLINGKPADELLAELIKNSRDVNPFVQQPAAEALAAKKARDEIEQKQKEQLAAQKELIDLEGKQQAEANRVMLIHADALRRFAEQMGAKPNPNALNGGAAPAAMPQLPGPLPVVPRPDQALFNVRDDWRKETNEATATTINSLMAFDKGFAASTSALKDMASEFVRGTTMFAGSVKELVDFLKSKPIPSEVDFGGTMTHEVNLNGAEVLATVSKGLVEVFEREWNRKMERQYSIRMNSPFPSDDVGGRARLA